MLKSLTFNTDLKQNTITDCTADIKVIFEYGGIGNKKFHYDNLIDPDGTYTSVGCVVIQSISNRFRIL